jgi:hypothetical protein
MCVTRQPDSRAAGWVEHGTWLHAYEGGVVPAQAGLLQGMVRQLRPGCFIPTDCGATYTHHGLRFASHDPRSGTATAPELQRKGDSASGDSKVTGEGMRAVSAHVPRGTTRWFEQRNLLASSPSTCRGYCEVHRPGCKRRAALRCSTCVTKCRIKRNFIVASCLERLW